MAVTINVIFNRAADAAGRRLGPARRRAGTVADAFRRHGVPGAAAALGARVPLGLLEVDWYAIYETMPADAAAGGDWPAISRCTAADAGLLSALRHEPADALRARFDAGDIAYLARDGDRLIGFIWIRSGSSPEGVIEFGMADDERWAYDLFVDPAYRGRRVGPALKGRAVAALATGGVRRVLSRIEHLNEPSRRSARSHGARTLASYAVVTLPGLAIIRERPVAGGGRWSLARRGRWPVRRTVGTGS